MLGTTVRGGAAEKSEVFRVATPPELDGEGCVFFSRGALEGRFASEKAGGLFGFSIWTTLQVRNGPRKTGVDHTRVHDS